MICLPACLVEAGKRRLELRRRVGEEGVPISVCLPSLVSSRAESRDEGFKTNRNYQESSHFPSTSSGQAQLSMTVPYLRLQLLETS